MSILESDKLATPCYFRADGIHCQYGYLYYSKPVSVKTEDIGSEAVATYQRVMVEGEPVSCSVCEGKGVIMTEKGKELLVFFETFLRPRIFDNEMDLS